ncbi:amidase [Actinomycetospora sp. CA-101289]|uniref:amidase n=1 Tax=Actinomycetospora sp. CA-101289 TaxID=3239893 RepID=UPI003D972512
MSGDPLPDEVAEPAALAREVARLGYVLDDEQVGAMRAAVVAAEPAIAALRARPVPLDGDADPAHGDRWPRTPVRVRERGSGGAASDDGDPEGVGGLLVAFAAGSSTPDRAVADALARLRTTHAALNSTIRFLDERATRAAEESTRRWAQGRPRPLEGVPFGVKDVIDVAGVPTTAGSWCHGDAPAAASATVVRRLEEAGAIPVSKDATTEFAVGGPRPPRFGAVRNPWDAGRWAGGSSTGSAAAVAARALPFALGTDVGGSVRLPSAWCGLTGLKPTAGAIPRTGVFPLSWTAESVGPLTRSAADAERLFALLRGPDGADPRAGELPPFAPEDRRDLAGLRVGVLGGEVTAFCDADVRAGVDAVVGHLAAAGADVVAAELPSGAAALAIGYEIVFAEAATLHRLDPDHGDRWDRYDPVTVRRISQGITTPAVDYLRALQFRAELQRELDAVLADVDLLVTPTCPSTAPWLPETGSDATVVVDGERFPLYAAQSRTTMIANLTGAPALALPSGFAADGCPTSVQFVGRPHDEATLLAVARVVQDRTDHHRRSPSPT